MFFHTDNFYTIRFFIYSFLTSDSGFWCSNSVVPSACHKLVNSVQCFWNSYSIQISFEFHVTVSCLQWDNTNLIITYVDNFLIMVVFTVVFDNSPFLCLVIGDIFYTSSKLLPYTDKSIISFIWRHKNDNNEYVFTPKLVW